MSHPMSVAVHYPCHDRQSRHHHPAFLREYLSQEQQQREEDGANEQMAPPCSHGTPNRTVTGGTAGVVRHPLSDLLMTENMRGIWMNWNDALGLVMTRLWTPINMFLWQQSDDLTCIKKNLAIGLFLVTTATQTDRGSQVAISSLIIKLLTFCFCPFWRHLRV